MSEDNKYGAPSSFKPEQYDDMRKFHVLDEIEHESESRSSDTDSDLPDDEVERMLEDALKNNNADTPMVEDKQEKPYEERDKVVLIQKGQNHFDILPEGWIQLSHNSGMPLYLHKSSRVCTLSKPYYLGSGSARKHEVPLSAVPCLSYRRALQQEDECAASNKFNKMLNARIETAKENVESQNLSPVQLQAYCEKLFRFRNIKVMLFKSWSHRRQFTKKHKQEKQLQRPTLPDGTKLITFPIQMSDGESSSRNSKREWIMNPNGKSHVCILHEYVQHALKKQPTYKFIELENAATPYAATICINDMQYGMGYGTSKKQAKTEAARSALEILIPEMRSKITSIGNSASTGKPQEQDLSFFDEIKIEDPRVAEFCAKTTEPLPHDILLTCLQRNFGLGDIQVSYEGNTLKNQKNEYKMTVGKHSATVICKNKRDGKQRASQAILQALHPHITSWGSLLRLYGNRSVKTFKEKKMEEQEITLLQSKAAVNSPNFAILNKLKSELHKLREKRNAIQPIGVFIPPTCEILPTFSSSNLENVDL